MISQKNNKITLKDYLEVERTSAIRHEYVDGEIFAMTGASLNHNRVNGNMFNEIKNQLKISPCDAFASDMRVKVNELETYTYPDIVVVCGDIELEKIKGLETLVNPDVIFEILSDSTEAYDRGKKFQHYRFLPSLQEYILVAQHHCLVEKYVRSDDGSWRYFTYETMEQTITIESIQCEVLLSDVYYRVEFEKNV